MLRSNRVHVVSLEIIQSFDHSLPGYMYFKDNYAFGMLKALFFVFVVEQAGLV